jgi:predicted SAM-dependent methyltransferase
MVLLQPQPRTIFTPTYQSNWKAMLKFELKSWLGRTFFNHKPLVQQNLNLLHLGCGATRFQGWVNADFFADLHPLKSSSHRPDWMLDLRFPLNCQDQVWDGVFSEHTLEHLYPDQALNLLKEIYRTMKPGAWLRLTVPDLKKYVDYYTGKPIDNNFRAWATGCEAMRSLTQDYIHLSVWDSELLTIVLQEVGFTAVEEMSFQQGNNPKLLKDSDERQWETLYMEAQKPN